MASDKVIVVLDRAEALILADMPVTVKDIEPGLWTNTVDAEISAEEKLRAALDWDREALIEVVAREIDPVAFRTDLIWRNSYEPERSRSKARRQAEAALAAIEGADHE